MKAIVFRQFGPPEVLGLEDVATPEPGPCDVLLKVQAVAVNRTLDLAVRAGRYTQLPDLPHVLGADPCGTVVTVGKDVTARKIGDRLACAPFLGATPDGQPIILGVRAWGGYAEYVKLPAHVTYVIPDELDFPTAAVVARHAPLAFTQLRDCAKVKAGEWVLIMGAAGGLGSIAVQAAKLLNARVIAAAGSDAGVDVAEQLGADGGVNYRTADLTAEVRRITEGRGVDVVLENVGDPELFPKAFAALTRGGRLVTAGGHGGGTVPLNINHLYRNWITIFGEPRETPENFALGLKFAAEGRLNALIDQVLPLSEAAHAHRLVEKGGRIGKILLDPTLSS